MLHRVSRRIAAGGQTSGNGRSPNALPRAGLVRHNGFVPSIRGILMKLRKKMWLCLCLLIATLASGQAKKGAPTSGAVSTAAKICDDPYAVREDADGWPEGPVTILFHRE